MLKNETVVFLRGKELDDDGNQKGRRKEHTDRTTVILDQEIADAERKRDQNGKDPYGNIVFRIKRMHRNLQMMCEERVPR